MSILVPSSLITNLETRLDIIRNWGISEENCLMKNPWRQRAKQVVTNELIDVAEIMASC